MTGLLAICAVVVVIALVSLVVMLQPSRKFKFRQRGRQNPDDGSFPPEQGS